MNRTIVYFQMLSFMGMIFSLITFSQSVPLMNDTVYVYEKIIIYDTVYIYETIIVEYENQYDKLNQLKEKNILLIDTIHAKSNLLIISGKNTATIPLDGIILNENIKNLKSMKKLQFAGLVLFAFRSMVIAQTEFEISFGGGVWFQNGNIRYVEKPYSPMGSVSITAKKQISGGNLSLKTGINYNYLIFTGSYQFDGTIGVWYQEDEFDDLNEQYNMDYHCISVPCLLSFDRYPIKPYAGINYNYLCSRTYVKEGFTGKYQNASNNFGINCGVGFTCGKRFLIELHFMHNLTHDYSYYSSEDLQEDEIIYLNNNQILLTINYNLKRNS